MSHPARVPGSESVSTVNMQLITVTGMPRDTPCANAVTVTALRRGVLKARAVPCSEERQFVPLHASFLILITMFYLSTEGFGGAKD